MPPLSYEEAYNATNPADSEEQRDASAKAILLGNRANQVYWDSRSELEGLRAQAEGHGVVVRGPDEEGESSTAVGTGTGETIEGTATEEPATALGPGDSATESGTPPHGDLGGLTDAELQAELDRRKAAEHA